ncbi:MAG: peptidoglycan DD-metalloendopeptidase family protein [Blastocatellia bacterium]
MKLITVAILVLFLAQIAIARPAQERKAILLDTRIYESYVGEYELVPSFVITIRRTANGLSLQATNQPEFELFAESETKFFLKVVDAQLSFVKNDKGEITHLILHQNGLDQKAAKRAAKAVSNNQAATRSDPWPFGLPIEMRVPIAPTPVKINGAIRLGYELHLTNFSPREIPLTRLEVLDGNGKILEQYEGADLASRVPRPDLPNNADKLPLGGGLRAVVFLWLKFDTPAAVPTTLRHRLISKPSPESEDKLESQPLKVRTETPLVIAPPLRGGEWVAANGPANASVHRRALIPVNSGTYIAQRFAIDWVQLNDSGATFTGDKLKNASYRCYGADALAVADAVVVATKDGIPENVPGANSRAVPITLETVGGNHVILDLGNNRYAFYAHLQPGSLRVKVGDKVKTGQVLGLVGNSGNSTEPHLHFHISDANSPLGSEGLPYVFASFEVQGKGGDWKAADKDVVEKREMEIPMQNAVVRFPSGQ